MTMIFIGLSGAAGAVSRFILSQWLIRYQRSFSFPIPIVIINLLGSFLLGISHLLLQNTTQEWGLVLSTWFLGAFTTFSTFSVEAITLMHEKKWKAFSIYIGLTIFGSILAYVLGSNILRMI